MRVLIGCEFSGIVRDAFAARGHDVMSCDLLPTEVPGSHYEGDVRNILTLLWDVAIFHPPCTRLTVAGARWFKGREQEQAEAIAFVEALWDAPIPHIAIEIITACCPRARDWASRRRLFSRGCSDMAKSKRPVCGSRACRRSCRPTS